MNTNYTKFLLCLLIPSFILLLSCSDIVNSGKIITGIFIYPNPMTEYAEISIFVKNKTTLSVTITDAYGRGVKKVEDNMTTDDYSIKIPFRMGEHPSGVYNCVVNCDGDIAITEFTVFK